MNQRGNYKHQTHTKETHILKDYKHQIDIPTDRGHCCPSEVEIGTVCTWRGRENRYLGIGGE